MTVKSGAKGGGGVSRGWSWRRLPLRLTFLAQLLGLGLLLGQVAEAAPGPQDTATDLYATVDAVQALPAPAASGDLVSLRVVAHNGGSRPLREVRASVLVRTNNQDKPLADVTINMVPARGAAHAVAEWAWDTTGLEGRQTLVVHLDPKDAIQQGDENAANNVALVSVELQPAPADEEGVAWATSQSRCCIFHYLSHTAVERDLALLDAEANAAFSHVETALGTTLNRRMEIFLIPRTIGHGGFAMGYLVLSYHDRHYPNGRFREVMRHEATHGMQDEWAEGDHILMMSEGLAVWIAGGHFKPEPIRARAASLVRINRYIPFDQLANDFYSKQHEVSYIEAAGFVQYLAETYGEDRLRQTFRAMRRSRGDRDLTILDRALSQVYQKPRSELEDEYRAWLAATPPDPVQERDLTNTILFFDTVRRYQQALDPTAYFQTPWMPNIQEAKRRGVVVDYIRHPETPVNQALETMLLAASEAQYAADYDRMEELLHIINSILDARLAAPERAWEEFFTDPTAAAYLAAVQTVVGRGYEAQRVDIHGAHADIWATRGPAAPLYRLVARQQGPSWRLFEWAFRDWTKTV